MLNINRLLDILATRRADGSIGEKYIINKYIDTLPNIQIDDYGNRYLVVQDNTGIVNPVMFTAHTDTVHNPKHVKKRQLITYDKVAGEVFLSNPGKNGATCLGADCGTGIEIMLNLIENNISGYYCFFRNEEQGGVGSQSFVSNPPFNLDKIDYCLSFDRKGVNSIITHQLMGQCCSNEFADALSSQIGLGFMSDPTGSFTDSANFTEIISECTNISVGYYNQHTPNEYQDIEFLGLLIDQLLLVDYASLPVKRDYSIDSELYYDNSIYGVTSTIDPAELDYDALEEWVYSNPQDATAMLFEYMQEGKHWKI